MATPLIGTEAASDVIDRVRFSHDAVIDMILANPRMTAVELAEANGYSVYWLRRVMNSDAFLARVAERKTELIDPLIVETIETQLKDLASESLATLGTALRTTKRTPEFAMEVANLSLKALNFGARPSTQVNVNTTQNSYVVALPEKAPSDEAWIEAHTGKFVSSRG